MNLSIVVPAYNCADHLSRCLRSLQEQSLDSLEILVCDDASTDGTADLIKEAAAGDRRIRAFRTARHCGSPAVPRNIALAHASGEYVGFVDADDWVDREMFASLRAAAAEADIVSADHFLIHEDGGVARKDLGYVTMDGEPADRAGVFAGHFSQVLHRIYRTRFLREHRITFPFLSISEDYCFSAACHLFARTTRRADGGWYHYNRNRPDSTTRLRQGALGLDNLNFFTDGIGYFERLGLWPQHAALILRGLLPSLAYTYGRLEEPYREVFRALLHRELEARSGMLAAETLTDRDRDLLRKLDAGFDEGKTLTLAAEAPPPGRLLATANRLHDQGHYLQAVRLYRLARDERPTLSSDLDLIITRAEAKAEQQDARHHWRRPLDRASDAGWREDVGPATPADSSRRVTGRLDTWPSPAKMYEGGRRVRNPRTPPPTNAPLVTVITTVRNDEARIAQCLESVRRQTHPCVEHLIIDAASSDGTLEVIRRHEDTIEYILSEPDEGIYAGINKGVQLAAGRYLLVLNADDHLEPEGIATLVDHAEKSAADLVFGSARLIDREDRPVGIRHSRWDASVLIRCPARHGAMLARADAYDIVGLYDATWRVIGDMVWMQKAYGRGLKVEVVDEAVFNFRQGGISAPDGDLHRAELLAHLGREFPGVDVRVLASLASAIRLTAEQITAIAHAYPEHPRLLGALAPLLPEPARGG